MPKRHPTRRAPQPLRRRLPLALAHQALDVEQDQEFYTDAGRPVKLGEGAPLAKLLA